MSRAIASAPSAERPRAHIARDREVASLLRSLADRVERGVATARFTSERRGDTELWLLAAAWRKVRRGRHVLRRVVTP